MADSPKPPDKYVPEFCAAVLIQSKEEIQKISLSISNAINEFNDKYKELIDTIADNEKSRLERNDKIYNEIGNNERDQLERIEKIYNKIAELDDLYHSMDKELFKAKEIYKVVSDQAKLNIDFNGQFISIEKRMKLLFRFIFIVLSGNLVLFYFLIRSWLGGKFNV